MNILITGGLGYVGGRAANYLKEKEPNAQIFITTRRKNKTLPEWTDRFTVLQMDVLDEKSIAECLNGIDVIIHLSALNEIDSAKDPESSLEINSRGTYRVLKMAKASNVEKFIYFSTFHVYGETSDSIITEQTPAMPFHPYAITHRAAEDFVNYFKHYHGIKTLVFRLSNGYGYPMHREVNRWTLVFNDLCRQAVTTGRIVLKSSGKQHRDFIALHDIARAVHHFLFVAPDRWGDGLYNLGGNCSMSILDVAQKISDVYKSKYKKEITEIKAKSDVDGGSEIPAPVRYSVEKLFRTGFALEGNMIFEIEKTLNLCEELIP